MTELKAEATSTNRLWGRKWSQYTNTVQKQRNLKTEVSQRATPAFHSNSRLKEQDERIRLGVGGSIGKLARGS